MQDMAKTFALAQQGNGICAVVAGASSLSPLSLSLAIYLSISLSLLSLSLALSLARSLARSRLRPRTIAQGHSIEQRRSITHGHSIA